MYRNIETYAPELMDRLIKIKDESVSFEMGGDTWPESNLMHSINGRMYGNLNGLVELISLFFNLFIFRISHCTQNSTTRLREGFAGT